MRSAPAAPIAITYGEKLTRPPKTSEAVARDVVHDIVSRGLRTGDRLPPEAAMVELYGVGRESLREGLRLLEVQGLLEIRRGPGGGPVVGRIEPTNLGRTATLYFHLAGATYEELFEAWAASESVLAHRAACNEDRAAVDATMTPYLEEGEVTDGNADIEVDEYVRHATSFHLDMARLAHNRVLELVMTMVGHIIGRHIVLTADPRDFRPVVVHHHRDIAAAVIAGEALEAGRLMDGHVRAMADFCAGQIGEQMYELIDWR